VSPWHCLKSSCQYVYVYREDDTSYFGCLQKIFAPELDLAAFAAASERGGRPSDPYGYLRVNRSPRPECPVHIEQAYAALSTPGCCCNPTFFLHPAGPPDEAIRLTSNVSTDVEPDPQG